MKKILAILLSAMMILGLFGCNPANNGDGSTESGALTDSTPTAESTQGNQATTEGSTTTAPAGGEDAPKPEGDPTTTKLNAQTAGIKVLGERQYVSTTEEQISCDWTCSGIEFVLNSLGGDVSFEADSDKPCYFRAYINGEEWKNGISSYYTVSGKTTVTLKNVPTGEITVRLIKVTGHTLARAQLYSVTYYGTLSETAPADQELYIEFVGDSISCGWGVVGAHDGTYSAQDGTYAYPYLLSQRLNADYSITALSGQGVIYHGTNIPNMYNGYLMSSPLRNPLDFYGFERQADIVVVNMGTNDYSKRGTNDINAETFALAYKQMLQTIREKNGADCKIVCLYNTMNDTFADSILAVCRELGGNTAGIYTFEMERAASGHPTIEENAAYTEALEALLESVIKGEILEESGNLKTESAGDGMSVDVSQFYPLPEDR